MTGGENQLQVRKPTAPLPDKQLLWILPSLRFWNQPAVWKHGGRILGPVVFGLWYVVYMAVVRPGLGLSGWPSYVLLAASQLLLIGVFERYIRYRLRKRRLLAAEDPATLP